jgi:hypothetical protein
VEEIKRAIKQMKSGKSPALDNIPPETLKVEIDVTAAALHPLFQKVWREEKMPADWKKGLLVKLPKKGDTSNCNNWRGITLLSVPSKVLTRIILDRIKTTVEQKLRKEQAGFREHRSCVILINSLRVIIEQNYEWNSTMYMLFVDFEKAFDSVDRCVMWRLLLKYGIPPKIVNLIRETYNGYECQVVHEGKLTEPFGVTCGVRQGCILSPIIFLLVIDDIMRKSTHRKRGLQWGLLDRLEDLDYAEDVCLLTHSFQHMKEKLKELEIEARKAGLMINSRKTKEMRLLSTSRERFVLDRQEI